MGAAVPQSLRNGGKRKEQRQPEGSLVRQRAREEKRPGQGETGLAWPLKQGSKGRRKSDGERESNRLLDELGTKKERLRAGGHQRGSKQGCPAIS